MSTYDLQLEALGKASRRAAMLSVLALLIVLASLAYGSYRLKHDIADLHAKKAGLQKEVGTLQTQLDNLRDSVKSLKYAQITPQNEVFQFQATANPKPGLVTSGGKKVYDFSIYMNGSPELLEKIQEVTYDFDHPTFINKHQESTDPESKFMVRYTGWGCLTQVNVVVYMKDGAKQTVPFDMCKSLGGDWD
jgi:hypothetical protein